MPTDPSANNSAADTAHSGDTQADGHTSSSRGLTRRGILGVLGGAGVAAAGFGVGKATAGEDHTEKIAANVEFYGQHQAGIATAAQDRLVFGSFDLITEDASELQQMLREWTNAAALMTVGKPIGTVAGRPLEPPDDTGEALGLPASQLTVTVGFSETLFTVGGKDRIGLAAKQPKGLRAIGDLPGDELEDHRSGGDICVQACANDPQVAFHALRNLARIGRGVVQLRWTQLGFGRTSTTSRAQSTPRNLMGFKDGTNNVKSEDTGDMNKFVWVGREEPQKWMHNGSYLVARRIRMLVESWDRDRIEDQEAVFGRTKVSGAPIGKKDEFDQVDLKAKDAMGNPLVAPDAHIRLAAPSENGNIKILRRGYSFTDGIEPETGQLDAGLFFISFQKQMDQFRTLQTNLGSNDALNEYIKHVGSASFAVPPGVRKGGYIGEGLFS